MLSDLPRVTQQGLDFEPMDSGLGLFLPSHFCFWAGVLKILPGQTLWVDRARRAAGVRAHVKGCVKKEGRNVY